MSVGGDVSAIKADMALVREAMDAGVWFHTCVRYACGADYNLLGRTFADARGKVPACICKIRCDNAEILRIDVENTLSRFGLERIHVAQLSRTARDRKEAVVEDFARQGPMWYQCHTLRERGLVGAFVLEVFFGCSAEAATAVEGGLFDGYAFYFNALNRETNNAFFDAATEARCPLISIRSGGFLDGDWRERVSRENPGHRDLKMHDELQPLFARSGCRDWLEFSLRFLFSLESVVTAIGGTRSPAHLRRHLEIWRTASPLPQDIVAGVLDIQRRWMAKA